MQDLTGKVALVTGSSRGIGRAVALALANAGASVIINFRTRASEAAQVEAEVRALGARAMSIQADVADAQQVERLVTVGANELGSISILINNAGIAKPANLQQVTERDWDEAVNVNLKSCFLVTQAVLPAMLSAQWGRIVNLSSVAAHIGGVVGPHYAASKAGVLGLTHFYASRLAKQGITVNAIAPALIETEMVTTNPNARAEAIPMGRFGRPEEVADLTLALIRNAYVTGQTINIDGGWYMT